MNSPPRWHVIPENNNLKTIIYSISLGSFSKRDHHWIKYKEPSVSVLNCFEDLPIGTNRSHFKCMSWEGILGSRFNTNPSQGIQSLCLGHGFQRQL